MSRSFSPKQTQITRRQMLESMGSALCIGVALNGGTGCGLAQKRRLEHAKKTGELNVNLYITVLPSSRVRLAINKAEIGQGVATGYATLVAEELEVDLKEIDFFFADSEPEFRTSGLEGVPLFELHATGGSTSIHEAFIPLRRAAASAREMLISAAAKQWKVPSTTCLSRRGRVVHPETQRSLAYGQLTRAAARETLPSNPPLKKTNEFRLIGRRTQRVDGKAKALGSAQFGIDVRLKNALAALVIHPPVHGAQIKNLEAGAAKRMEGVAGVYAFDFGVAIVADKYWRAQLAARKVTVKWKSEKTSGLSTRNLAAAARRRNKAGAIVKQIGNAGDALSSAPSLSAVYEAPYLAHAPLEPQNCSAFVAGDRAEIWAPCQVPSVIQESVADAIGIAASDVLVHTTYSGGGFGRRLLGDFAAEAAAIAKRVGRPIKLIWSRESDLRQGAYRPAATAHLEGAVHKGRVGALRYHSLSQPIGPHQFYSTRGGQPTWVPHFARHLTAKSMGALFQSNTNIDWFATEGASDTPYEIENLQVEYTPIKTGIPVGFWRSVGHSFNAFFIESFIDELASHAGSDPYEFRRKMLRAGTRSRRVLDEVAKLSRWRGRRSSKTKGWGIARHTSFGTEVAQVAEVQVKGGAIRVKRVWCVVDCGLAVNPDVVTAQMEGAIIFGLSAALFQQITLVEGKVQESNFDTFPALRMFQCPEITVRILNSGPKPSGVGEPGLPPIAPAVAGAIYAATGVRLRRMPLQAELQRIRRQKQP